MRQQGNKKQAKKHYQKALRLNPASPLAHYHYGKMLMEEELLDKAKTHFRKAVRLKPQYVEAWKDLGTVLKEQGKKEKVIDAYQTVVQYEKDSPGVWLTLGLLLEEQGEIEKAKQALSNAVKYQPDNAEEHDIGIVWAKWGALLEQDGNSPFWRKKMKEVSTSNHNEKCINI